jgi:hypothetical protein
MPDDVAAQVAEAVTYEMKAKGGVMILAGRSPARRGPCAPVVEHLRLEHQLGRVCYVDRDWLLSYCFVRRYLNWESDVADDGVTIRISSVDDGAGETWVPTPDELVGLTFYTPDAQGTRVFLAGEELVGVTANPPDRTRRCSVTIGSVPTRPPDDRT